MKELKIAATQNTPAISWIPETSTFEVVGRSFPENARKFYSPLVSWAKEFGAAYQEPVRFRFRLDYVSSSSVITLLELLRALEAALGGSGLVFEWQYDPEDDDMHKVGNDYSKLLSTTFEFVEVVDD